jgi:hypothetical protein
MALSKSHRQPFSVGRLAAELVVVVFGILIALGIDSWWSNRQDRDLEYALLTQLHGDLTRAEDHLSVEIEQTETAGRAASNVVRASWGEFEVSGDSVAAWLRRAGWYSDPVPTVATAQSIASSGDLYVVRSDALRASIVALLDELRQLDSRVLRFERTLDGHYRELNRLVDPGAGGE